MKVLLLKQVDALGKAGEVKEVANGYAQNYLFKNKLAVVANDKIVAKFSVQLEQKKKVKKKSADAPGVLAQKLCSTSLIFSEKADENGTLFAGVTKEKIAKELESKGMMVKTKQVDLTEAIKTAGEYKVAINVASNLKSEVKIIVNKK